MDMLKGTNKYQIDISEYARGIYHVRLNNTELNFMESIKVIKQ